MRRLVRSTVVVLFALGCYARALSAAELSSETKAAIDAKIEAFMKELHVPGLSAAIVVDHEICYERGYGLADVENEVPATEKSVYRLGSISKMLTAAAVMQLVEDQLLDLSAPIQKYVPGFPEKQAPITCGLLLKHQSGIRHYKDGAEVRSAVAYPHVRDSFPVFQDDPLLFTPGEKFSYTTYGYNVLGAAVEGASEQDYVEYVQEQILEPAGMKSTGPDRPEKIIPHRAAGYRMKGPVIVNDWMVDISNKVPGGGWCGTASDLARFAVAVCQGKLVSNDTLEVMWTPRQTAKGETTESGYGCFIRTVDGDRRISHSGGQPKISTYLTFSPAQKTAVALMCNLSGTSLQPLAVDIMKMIAPVPSAK